MSTRTINITQLPTPRNDGLSEEERADLKQQLSDKLQALSAPENQEPLQQARLQLDIAEKLNALERRKEAWDLAQAAFATAIRQESWSDVVEACDVLFQSQQEDSLAALGMGIWLAVTFPVDPELTAAMLIHIVDETADDSDGAAVAAMTARYVIDLRADDEQHESLSFLADRLIATVAERHGGVQDQAALDRWLDRLQLRDPRIFLPRLAMVLDDLVGDRWWFDRDELRRRLPE